MNIVLESPLDMHLHLREGTMLKHVAPHSARSFAGAVVMPNLVSPVDSLERLHAYRKEILQACGEEQFAPFMTLFFRNYNRQELAAARQHILGIKLYPAGVTTQSESGVDDFKNIEPTLELMQEFGIPLLVHGETHGFVMEREAEFLEVYSRIVSTFPRLHVVMEHITTAAAVRFLEQHDQVSATVTLHHLLITLDDVVGETMRPDLFCKPIAKTPTDREALRREVFNGNEKIMFGSDSAPHPRNSKECIGCAAGVYSAPVALQMLVQLFEEQGCLEVLQGFVSDNARKRYGITPPAKQIILTDRPCQVPGQYHGVIPFAAGEQLRWSLEGEAGKENMV